MFTAFFLSTFCCYAYSSPLPQPVSYDVTSPCAIVRPTVTCTAGTPEFASPAVQVLQSGDPAVPCLPLGQLDANTTMEYLNASNPATGIQMTLKDGVNHPNCPGGRTLVYQLYCDADAPQGAGPSSVTNDACEYTVVWRSPAACPAMVPSGSPGCNSAHVPLPTAPQLAYQQAEIMALIHFNMGEWLVITHLQGTTLSQCPLNPLPCHMQPRFSRTATPDVTPATGPSHRCQVPLLPQR